MSTTELKRTAKERAAAAIAEEVNRLNQIQNDLAAAIIRAEEFAALRDELRGTVDDLTALGFARNDAIEHLGLPTDLARVIRTRPRKKAPATSDQEGATGTE